MAQWELHPKHNKSITLLFTSTLLTNTWILDYDLTAFPLIRFGSKLVTFCCSLTFALKI